MANQTKIDQLLQFILLAAGQQDEFLDRSLGAIHLVKYVYLADLFYARHNKGRTYTGLKWVFHHFGPWSVECYKRIEPALEAVGATKKKIESAKHDDFIRWSADDYDQFEKCNEQMDLIVSGTIQKYMQKFGSDTYGLLDFVYKTEPMLNAAPEETLDFMVYAVSDLETPEDKPKLELSDRQKKKQRQKLLTLKGKLNQKLEERIKARKAKTCPLPPRYDDVFFEGLAQLDQSAGVHLEEGKYVAFFDDNVWKSKARHDPELS